MKKLQRIISIGIILVISLALFTGCSGNNKVENNETSKEISEKQEEEVTLKFFIPGYTDPTYKKAYDVRLEAFKKANPDIKIEVIGEARGEFQKLMSMIQVGEAPDVMIMGSRRLNQIADMGEIIQLDEYLSDERKAEYVESVLNTGKVDGKQFGLPMAFSSRALYYRKDLIKEVPKTWDELIEVAKKVEEENPGIKGFAIPAAQSDATIAQLYNFIFQNGAKATDENGNLVVNTPEIIESVQYYVDLYTKHNVVPNPVELHRKIFLNYLKMVR